MKYHRKIPIDLECGVTIFELMAGGKWTPYLINYMSCGFKRPSEFRSVIPNATKRVLQQQLNIMEETGLVHKEIFVEISARVEYTLTDRGRSLLPIIRMMDLWGARACPSFQ